MTTQFTLESSDRDADEHYVHLQVLGDGTLDYYIDTFRSFLLSCGFTRETVDMYIAGTSEELDLAEQCPTCGRDW